MDKFTVFQYLQSFFKTIFYWIASEEQLTATSSALQSALSELQEMRAARQRTEDMV